MSNLSRFEEFVINAQKNPDYQTITKNNGSFEFNDCATKLVELQNKLNRSLLQYLFMNDTNEHLIEHLAEKFAYTHQRNLLSWLGSIDSQYKFFIMHELKTNSALFAHC